MAIDSSGVTSDTWTILATHDWGAPEGIEATMRDALDELDETDFSETVYDYIDLEAALRVLDPGAVGNGASEIRFEYNDHDMRLTHDGRISVRE